MSTLFTRHSPDALTLREAVELEKKRAVAARKRRKQQVEAETLARQGRGGDTKVAHVARGEMVIPRALQTPELMAALSRAAAIKNIPLATLRIGSPKNSINPNTGLREFGLLNGYDEWLARVRGNEPEATVDASQPSAMTNGISIDPGNMDDFINQVQEKQNGLDGAFNNVMHQRANLISALQNPGVQAGLDTISNTEGNTNYNTRYGINKTFDDFSQFPAESNKGSPSGRYQIEAGTYNDVAPKLGINDFSPQSQDLIAAYLLQRGGALDPLRSGDMQNALPGASGGWASLPQGPDDLDRSRYNQRAMPYDNVMDIYQQNLRRRYLGQ